MRTGATHSLIVALLVAVAGLIVAPPTATIALTVAPALGRWEGTGIGGTVYFVVSQVRGVDVFSDLAPIVHETGAAPMVGAA